VTLRITKNGYKLSKVFYHLVHEEILPGIDIDADYFWEEFSNVLTEFTPRNEILLETRNVMQSKIDSWHSGKNNQPTSKKEYQAFLTSIGYLVPEKEGFVIATRNVDPEVAIIAGPQLVVPLMNARFALNAANARWGSLYDALYGSDIISDGTASEMSASLPGKYNPLRGALVQTYAKDFLDESFPLTDNSHKAVTDYSVVNNTLVAQLRERSTTSLVDQKQLVGYKGSSAKPTAILLINNGLHIEVQIDDTDPIGKADAASIKDILMESALTTIQDCEDSIAAVDAEDKILVYRNWLGLMKGDLTETFSKGGRSITRQLNPDRHYTSAKGKQITLPGRSLQFIRNVGHLMTTNLVLTGAGNEVPEGIVDAVITSLIALHDLRTDSSLQNSQYKSIYIVKPKMHGPEEVKFTTDLFGRVEACLGLPSNTIKLGIMDEERRTSANLKECIRAAKDRVAFINTGFLDRTGDEIHTSMLAGAMVRKDLMKHEKWISVYEERNVRIGLETGFKGKAQIGKGMWAVPDQMSAMLEEKIAHLQAGANCAWVPSPTAATLHALHYHQINVAEVQSRLLAEFAENGYQHDDLSDLLTIPLLKNKGELTEQAIQNELDNNVQGLLGYVVRWVDQGIGCSTVPDINNIGRMEDRATLRISSQHICNWLHHEILTEQQIIDSLQKMAEVVDKQNNGDPNYHAMSPNFEQSIAYQAAKDLIFKGRQQPSGYTEPLLHKRRKQIKNVSQTILAK